MMSIVALACPAYSVCKKGNTAEGWGWQALSWFRSRTGPELSRKSRGVLFHQRATYSILHGLPVFKPGFLFSGQKPGTRFGVAPQNNRKRGCRK
ncbi:hypothetical protein LJC04_00445 [Ruminococcaceae bacterium OttesenSCG-928-O06]|nr:hypothetical protein [Ruminococcaceae bacterium OttesenSCG-928-O06]